MPLEKELAYFSQNKDRLLAAHEGKFALVKDDEFVGAYDTAENAYQAGVTRFGDASFLVKQVVRAEQVYTNHALSMGLLRAHI